MRALFFCAGENGVSEEQGKQRAALAALAYLKDGDTLGVGTGSTVDFFIEALGHHAGRLRAVVSSSEATTAHLERLGITVSELATVGDLDLYVDGADEATKHRHLIKGGGGALTREKVLANASRRFVCVVDSTKVVGILGRFPLPIEVIPMARSYVARQLVKVGGQPHWRQNFVTDNGNHILDVHNLSITDPGALETRLNDIAGVVTVGLFAHRPADLVLVGTAEGVSEIQ
jgi:ribose 5-phosphate isomerase A